MKQSTIITSFEKVRHPVGGINTSE